MTSLPIICLWLCAMSVLVTSQPPSVVNYMVILDACYQWTTLKIIGEQVVPNFSIVPDSEIIYNQTFRPGVEQYRNDKPGLRSYLGRMVSVAVQKVPEPQHIYTPLFLMATSGMRLLPGRVVENLLIDARAVLSDKTMVPFSYHPSQVMILTGQEEAAYSLVSVNYFRQRDEDKMRNETIVNTGVMDLTPAALQIAFETPELRLLGDKYPISFLGRPFPYAHNYLMFGSETIQQKLVQTLLLSQPQLQEFIVPIDNPCLLSGDSMETTIGLAVTVIQNGTGEPLKCKQVFQEILQPSVGADCAPKDCAIGPVYQPSVKNVTFMATQGFVDLVQSLGMENTEHLRIDQLEDAAIHYCKQSVNPGVAPQNVSQPCLLGIYISTVLQESFGFSPDTRDVHLFSSLLGQTDWSLGFFLDGPVDLAPL